MLESLLACYLSPLILVVLVHLAVLGFVKVTFLGILSSDLHVLLQLEVLVEQLHEVHLRHVVEEVDEKEGDEAPPFLFTAACSRLLLLPPPLKLPSSSTLKELSLVITKRYCCKPEAFLIRSKAMSFSARK